jgi:tetratricopeptide (TPR) repeat protein
MSVAQSPGIAGDLHGLWEFSAYVTDEGIIRPPLASPQGQLREFLFFGADGTFFYAKFARDAELSWDPDASRFVSAEGAVLASGTWTLDGNRLIESLRVAGGETVLPNVLTLDELTSNHLVIVEPTKSRQTLKVAYDRETVEQFPAPPLPEEDDRGQQSAPTDDEAIAHIEAEQQHVARLIDGGQFNSAHRLAQRTLQYSTRVFGADHLNTAAGLVTLGACLSKVGDPAGAVDALERAYRVYVARVGPDDALTASALNNLAPAYRAEGRWRKAVDAALGAVRIRSITFGLEQRTATSIQNLGLALSGLGLLEDAAGCYFAAAAIFAATHGAAHPRTQRARQNVELMAAALERDQRFPPPAFEPPRTVDDAIVELERILSACQSKLSDEADPDLFVLRFGRVAHAESYVNRVFDIRREQGRIAAQSPGVVARVAVLRAAQTHLLDAIGVPRSRLDATLKRVDPAAIGPKARATLACAFPNFEGGIDRKVERDKALRTFGIDAAAGSTYTDQKRAYAEKYGYGVRFVEQQFRRYSGESNLPRGRYYTVCKDASGDDGQTLCRELFEYVDQRIPGFVFVTDTHDRELVGVLAALGLRRNDPAVHFLVAMLVAPPDEADRKVFRHFLGPALTTLYGPFETAPDRWNGLSLVVIPTVATRIAVDDIVDLRQRDAQSWLFRFFRDGDGAVSVRSPGRTIDDFTQMLPALLYPEYGGSGFTKSLGSWMRVVGVQGLVFPSARSDVSVTMRGASSVRAFHGWNFVDYRKVDVVPDTQFHVEDNDWYGFGLRGDVTPTLTVRKTSWAVEGIETRWREMRQMMLTLLASSRP